MQHGGPKQFGLLAWITPCCTVLLRAVLVCSWAPMLDKLIATMFRLCQIARSVTIMFTNLLPACYLANATCASCCKHCDHSDLRHSHCLSVTCILSCCCCPLIPPHACGSCGNFLVSNTLLLFDLMTFIPPDRLSRFEVILT